MHAKNEDLCTNPLQQSPILHCSFAILNMQSTVYVSPSIFLFLFLFIQERFESKINQSHATSSPLD